MTRDRRKRQEAIRHIVRSGPMRTQQELVDRLAEEGLECTQATVSRDIKELGLTKAPDGAYVLAEDLHLQRMVDELVQRVVHKDNLLIIKTSPGTAQGVAAAVDAADFGGILGSIAGDDTVLIITEDEATARYLQERLDGFMHQET